MQVWEQLQTTALKIQGQSRSLEILLDGLVSFRWGNVDLGETSQLAHHLKLVSIVYVLALEMLDKGWGAYLSVLLFDICKSLLSIYRTIHEI